MEALTLLGTGAALATKCYNTCFTISQNEEHFLVDGGGGNQILIQLEKADISLTDIHHVFVSHCHTDHIMGIIWVIRSIGHQISRGIYDGNLSIYGFEELLTGLRSMGAFMLPKSVLAHFDSRILFIPLKDQQEISILGRPTKFFDLQSIKDRQFAFTMTLTNQKKLTFFGDEPYQEKHRQYGENVDFLLHEAFCLERDRKKFQPHKIHHCTVKDAAEYAEGLQAKNLILYHTEDYTLDTRKFEYSNEAKQYFTGKVIVPDDLDIITLE